MKNSFWNKKIPTLIGLFVIVTAILGTTYLTRQQTLFTQEASQGPEPKAVRITNVSNSSFTVSYFTDSPVPGVINFGKGNINQTGAGSGQKIHSFTIKNLEHSTRYAFNILSGEKTYLNNGVPYQVQTGPEIASKSATGFLVGKIINPKGEVPKEAIVYMTSKGASPLSTLIKNDGTYTLSFEELRNESLSSFFKFGPGSKIKILVVSDEGSSNIEVLAKEIVNVPTIMVSKDYNFSDEAVKEATPSGEFSEFPTVENETSIKIPKITSPLDKTTLTQTQPIFRGTGIPNDKIRITIESEPIKGEAVVDASGNWTFKPSTSLPPGEHKITIRAKDSSGIIRKITQIFTIEGAEAASPSASSSATPSAPTPIPTPIPTATPTPIPSPTPIVVATPVPTLPPTGGSEINTGILGAALAVLGGFFFILARFLL